MMYVCMNYQPAGRDSSTHYIDIAPDVFMAVVQLFRKDLVVLGGVYVHLVLDCLISARNQGSTLSWDIPIHEGYK